MTRTQTHKINWYVVVGGERIPRTATMRGTWAYEATCSCGWDSKTGGATLTAIRHDVEDHKWEAEIDG